MEVLGSGSLDFHFLVVIKLGFSTNPPNSYSVFAGGSTATKSFPPLPGGVAVSASVEAVETGPGNPDEGFLGLKGCHLGQRTSQQKHPKLADA